MTHNRVTVYSVGIADFQKSYPVSKKTTRTVRIPVRESHLADLLGSLTVMGPVQIESPPRYHSPAIDENALSIDPSDLFISLADNLVGARVSIDKHDGAQLAGILAGQHPAAEATGGEPVVSPQLVILTQRGLERVPIKELAALRFDDDAIQEKVDQALANHLRQINPDSTTVELDLGTEDPKAVALVQYAVPAAAWKISYRLLLNAERATELQGHAIVDNNTEDDWNDVQLAVVTGQPITFSTDLAACRIPQRNHINVVMDHAPGAVEISDSMMMEDSQQEEFFGGVPTAPMAARMRNRKFFREQSASFDSAEVSETGDFCRFEAADPVTIPAHQSAMVPIFQSELPEAKAVLHYRHENHPDRPHRAIEFVNSAGHPLGRGVCSVFDGLLFAGSCILPAMQPGETRMLGHAVETGVRVGRQLGSMVQRRIGLRVSDGAVLESSLIRRETRYQVVSARTEAFEMVVDHAPLLDDPSWKLSLSRLQDGQWSAPEPLEFEKLPETSGSGVRIRFAIEDHEELAVVVTESQVSEDRVALVGKTWADEPLRVQWLVATAGGLNISLDQHPAIRRCIDLRTELDEVEEQIQHAQKEIERLESRQERLRKNLAAVGDRPESSRWQVDLGKAEDAIVQLYEERLPRLEESRQALRKELFAALRTVHLEWND